VRVEVELDWEAALLVTRDVSGQLRFPSGLRPVPAIYWFRLTGVGVTRHYVGEAEDLVRWMAGYRAGYEKQTTNRRLNLRMHEHLNEGGRVEMSIATSGAVTVDGRRPVARGGPSGRRRADRRRPVSWRSSSPPGCLPHQG
jgi:hypothetical protein